MGSLCGGFGWGHITRDIPTLCVILRGTLYSSPTWKSHVSPNIQPTKKAAQAFHAVDNASSGSI